MADYIHTHRGDGNARSAHAPAEKEGVLAANSAEEVSHDAAVTRCDTCAPRAFSYSSSLQWISI